MELQSILLCDSLGSKVHLGENCPRHSNFMHPGNSFTGTILASITEHAPSHLVNVNLPRFLKLDKAIALSGPVSLHSNIFSNMSSPLLYLNTTNSNKL